VSPPNPLSRIASTLSYRTVVVLLLTVFSARRPRPSYAKAALRPGPLSAASLFRASQVEVSVLDGSVWVKRFPLSS
jgi:hypothetical protein